VGMNRLITPHPHVGPGAVLLAPGHDDEPRTPDDAEQVTTEEISLPLETPPVPRDGRRTIGWDTLSD
jgi:hypothetical protein